MKKAVKIFAVLFGIIMMTNVAFAADDFTRSGFLGNPSVYDLLKKVSGDDLIAYRWIKPGVDPKTYNKFMVDSVIFFLADKADYKGIDPQEMKDLCDEFNKQLVAAFKAKNLQMVSDPGADVLRIRTAITNVQPSRPGASAVTSIIPIGLGVSLVKRGATGGWVGSGSTAAEIIFQDSVTTDIIAMGATQRAAAFDERFSKWGSANDSFKFWSERVADALVRFKAGNMRLLAQ
ncbi:MAG TPA: DUF3313 domain-containing protein [Syntrophales bacterium]|nr:DUF3313 domain-containing protein [Syntrophales bacterium]HOX93217.1 DUF3313 domain-containing protein [Syntrophales bacterium]HPI57604.1 DUF3313 domain-containing protein [Syntrophales bacterium]HPN25383.1 DUF3313 domain-containing protein [Syntrophales bacterium]HQM29675.1 DUF3313 domain-containing protein [Syntrophales bacterium]